eukprot:m.42763 g.42763  ORF g.42763 m.42763 type:complete len:71 (+) comp15035_c0_seq3:2970-3182(+)
MSKMLNAYQNHLDILVRPLHTHTYSTSRNTHRIQSSHTTRTLHRAFLVRIYKIIGHDTLLQPLSVGSCDR